MGKTFEIEDRVEWTKRIEARILDIFVKRSREAKDAGTAEVALTVAKLKKNWERKDWWLSSDDCIRYGVVDEVR
jgi:ATP-dependent protease ClpP protease subunit